MATAENATAAAEEAAPSTNVTRVNPDFVLPDYVCCVITDGIWIWFFFLTTFAVLILIVTLKYCKKRLAKPRFKEKNKSLLLRYVVAEDRGAVDFVREEPIPVAEFLVYYTSRRKLKTVDRLETTRILESFPKRRQPPDLTAREPINAKKNFDSVSLPFDFNRVKLDRSPNGDDDALTDYVNASRVDGGERRWIVAQSPQEGAGVVADFWHLVWQERSPALVMLTRTYELIKVMSAQYWPLFVGKTEQYGDFSVTVIGEESYAHYKVIHLAVTSLMYVYK